MRKCLTYWTRAVLTGWGSRANLWTENSYRNRGRGSGSDGLKRISSWSKTSTYLNAKRLRKPLSCSGSVQRTEWWRRITWTICHREATQYSHWLSNRRIWRGLKRLWPSQSCNWWIWQGLKSRVSLGPLANKPKKALTSISHCWYWGKSSLRWLIRVRRTSSPTENLNLLVCWSNHLAVTPTRWW